MQAAAWLVGQSARRDAMTPAIYFVGLAVAIIALGAVVSTFLGRR